VPNGPAFPAVPLRLALVIYRSPATFMSPALFVLLAFGRQPPRLLRQGAAGGLGTPWLRRSDESRYWLCYIAAAPSSLPVSRVGAGSGPVWEWRTASGIFT